MGWAARRNQAQRAAGVSGPSQNPSAFDPIVRFIDAQKTAPKLGEQRFALAKFSDRAYVVDKVTGQLRRIDPR